MKVHVVDGTFELFRCFHGAPRHLNEDGREVGAVRGYLHTMLSLLKGDDVTHVAVAFDALPAPRGSAGNDAGALIRTQAALTLEATRALGIRLWPMVRFQADDALATAAFQLKDDPAVEQVVVCTTDTDLYQTIVGERVVVLDRIRKQITDADALHAKLGIRPPQFPDYLAIVGAPTKGIPGIPGFGSKTTAALLEQFERLEDIPDDPEHWRDGVRGKERLAKALRDQRDEALLVKALATLRTDLPIDCTPDALQWRGVDRQRLDAVIETAQCFDLRQRLQRWDRYDGS